ncbi:MAG: AAA family ATPase, partial [Clostridia bacterium]|nr:AAA family ATPase [Clostridia bacterium]
MRIDKIEIDGFGRLNDFSLTLADGFNLIYGENESGKSTLCDFLLSMFYDMPNDGKRLALSESFRRKYKPWQGERFGGRVYFTHAGKRFLLEKSFGNTKRTDRARLLDADTWDDCGSAENAGERFFGLGREGFLKTLFIRGLGADAEGLDSTEILTRLSNQETSGDEDISYINIQNALEKEQHAILTKTGKGGKLYALKEKLQTLELEKASALHLHAQTKEKEQQAAQQQQEMESLSAAYQKTEALHQKALSHERFLAQQKTAETCTILLERLAREKQKEAEWNKRLLAQTEKEHSYISQTELDNAKMLEKEIIILENKQEEAQRNRQICLENAQTKHARNKRNTAILGIAVLAAFLLGGFIFKEVINPWVFFGAGLLCSVALFVLLWKKGADKGALSSAEETLSGISEELSNKKQQAARLLDAYDAEDFNAFFA